MELNHSQYLHIQPKVNSKSASLVNSAPVGRRLSSRDEISVVGKRYERWFHSVYSTVATYTDNHVKELIHMSTGCSLSPLFV